MKTLQIVAITIASVLFVLFVGVSIYQLAATNLNEEEAFSLPAAPAIPRPEETSVVECENQSVNEYIAASDHLISQWDDAVTLADSTSRIALSPVVANMQSLRQQSSNLIPPPCMKAMHEAQMIFMDYGISAFLLFMQNKNSYLVDLETEAYANARLVYGYKIQDFRQDALSAYNALYMPTTLLDTFTPPENWQRIRMVAEEPMFFFLPEGWNNPPASSYDKIKITDTTGDIVLEIYTKSNADFVANKSPLAVEILIKKEFLNNGMRPGKYVKLGNNFGTVVVVPVSDGKLTEIAGAIQTPTGEFFAFHARKSVSSMTENETQLIYGILSSMQRIE